MEIPTDVPVYCQEALCGRSTYIILNPVTNQVTHLVVAQETFPSSDRLVPIQLVAETTPHRVALSCSKAELSEMPHFTEAEFVPPEGSEGDRLMMWPYAVPESGAVILEHERIPPGELAIRRGARVEASDGPVGRVDEFIVDPKTCYFTHLVMREGHLWGAHEIAIPVSEIVQIDEDTVYLKLDKAGIEALPRIPTQRPRTF